MERSIATVLLRFFAAVAETIQRELHSLGTRRTTRRLEPTELKFYIYFVLAQPKATDQDLRFLAARLRQLARPGPITYLTGWAERDDASKADQASTCGRLSLLYAGEHLPLSDGARCLIPFMTGLSGPQVAAFFARYGTGRQFIHVIAAWTLANLLRSIDHDASLVPDELDPARVYTLVQSYEPDKPHPKIRRFI